MVPTASILSALDLLAAIGRMVGEPLLAEVKPEAGQ